MLVVALMGAVALVSLAGARRTDTAVSRFMAHAGVQGQVSASPAVLRRVAALPSVAWTQRGTLIFAVPYAHGRPQGQVLPWAILDHPPQFRPIIVAGRMAGGPASRDGPPGCLSRGRRAGRRPPPR